MHCIDLLKCLDLSATFSSPYLKEGSGKKCESGLSYGSFSPFLGGKEAIFRPKWHLPFPLLLEIIFPCGMTAGYFKTEMWKTPNIHCKPIT